jgi:hypothetical protein
MCTGVLGYRCSTDVTNASDVLLAIAWVNLHAAYGRCVELRVLLGQESILRFISKLLCQPLQTTLQCDDLQIHRFEKIILIMRGQRLCLV